MNEIMSLVLAWGTGGLLGVYFFGGLWWTIRKGISSTQPALWFFGSMLLRMSVTLLVFYCVSDGHAGRLLLCLIGFVMARLAVTLLTRPIPENATPSGREPRHAP